MLHIADSQRQFRDAHKVDHLPHTCGTRFHKRGVRLDLDLLSNLPHFQCRIDHGCAADLEHDTGLLGLTETFLGHFNLIRTGRKIGNHVIAVCAAGRIADLASRGLGRFDRRTRNSGSTGILDGAVERDIRILEGLS